MKLNEPIKPLLLLQGVLILEILFIGILYFKKTSGGNGAALGIGLLYFSPVFLYTSLRYLFTFYKIKQQGGVTFFDKLFLILALVFLAVVLVLLGKLFV